MSLELAARHLAAKGRNGDSVLVHMTPGEVAGLHALARAHGGAVTINPETGLPEANFLKKLLPTIAGAAISGLTGVNPMTSALLVGGATGLASGSLSKGLAAGLGAYGGAGLMGGLTNLGATTLANQAAQSLPAEAFAEGLSPAQMAPPASTMDKLSAGVGRLTQEGGPTALVNAMGGNKDALRYGLAGLAGMSAMAPDRTVPTVTQAPAKLRPMAFERRAVPWQEAQRTGRYFEDRLEPMPVVNAAEGGLMASDTDSPVQFMADGGQAQALDMARLQGMQQGDAINYLRGITPGQVNITGTPNPGEGGGMLYGDYRPIYAPDQEGGAGALTGFQRTLTPTFDPTYAGGRYGDYAAFYNPQGALQDIRFNPQERYGTFLDENLEWIGPLAVGGAALAGGLLGGAGAGALGGGEAAAAGGAGGGASAATNTGLGALGTAAAGALTNPYVQGAIIAGLAGAAAGTPETQRTGGTGDTVPTVTNPIVTNPTGTTATPAGGTTAPPGGMTQSQLAYEYLMGRRPTSRLTAADLTLSDTVTPELLARNLELDRRNRRLPQPSAEGLADLYRQQVAQGASERQIVDQLRNQGVSTDTMNAARNALLGVPQNTSWEQANALYAARQQQAVAAPLADQYRQLAAQGVPESEIVNTMRQNGVSDANMLAARNLLLEQQQPQVEAAPAPAPAIAPSSITPQSIAAAYQQAVGSGAMTEAQFAQRAMQDYGVSVAQLGEARNMLLNAQGMATGGLAALARGGDIGHLGDYSDGGRLLRGPGDGVSDNIPATINGKRPARLADGEFVVPARIVSELGNGSTPAGARQLYAMMDRIQKRRRKTTGANSVAVDSKARKLLPA